MDVPGSPRNRLYALTLFRPNGLIQLKSRSSEWDFGISNAIAAKRTGQRRLGTEQTVQLRFPFAQ
ncbi:hypothetical protein D3871_13510 [Noviherbaspirillum saxi]|uniref:Uncharacterized protein n=1 Tax=Noviherbaspirillum saxi TaxID=2320863 RepID=A0A3A3FTQ3_9BURK|nr:hypothetical protein D3871_13510 [Noviherbaspirillum saxi]